MPARIRSIDPRTGIAVEDVSPESSSARTSARAVAAALDAAPGLDAMGIDRAGPPPRDDGRRPRGRPRAPRRPRRARDRARPSSPRRRADPDHLPAPVPGRGHPGRRATSRPSSITPTTRRWAGCRTCGGCSCPSVPWRCSRPATSRSPSALPAATRRRRSRRAARSWSRSIRRTPRPPRRCSTSLVARRIAAGAPDGTIGLVLGPRGRHGAGHAPGRAGRRVHRVHERWPRAVRPRVGPPGPDPVLRRARQPQPARGDAGGGRRARTRRSARAGSASFTLGTGQFCTKPGPRAGPGRAGRRRLPRRRRRGGGGDRAGVDAQRQHPRGVPGGHRRASPPFPAPIVHARIPARATRPGSP